MKFIGRIAVIAMAGAPAVAQNNVALVDSTGTIAGRPFADGVVLVTEPASHIVAPASIRALAADDGRAVSGLATWQTGGGVLYTSADCSIGAHVYTGNGAGLRAAAQVQTARGVVLFVGALGAPRTVSVRSILYDNGCSAVTVRQNGLVPVDVAVNLTTAFPPPLSFR
jgi:hypothetical protein